MKNKNVFYSVLLFCLFLCKIGSFHVYTHQDSSDLSLENCDLCQSVNKNDGDDFLFSNSFTEIDLAPIVETKVEFGTPGEKKSTSISIRLQCRPPPAPFS